MVFLFICLVSALLLNPCHSFQYPSESVAYLRGAKKKKSGEGFEDTALALAGVNLENKGSIFHPGKEQKGGFRVQLNPPFYNCQMSYIWHQTY